MHLKVPVIHVFEMRYLLKDQTIYVRPVWATQFEVGGVLSLTQWYRTRPINHGKVN